MNKKFIKKLVNNAIIQQKDNNVPTCNITIINYIKGQDYFPNLFRASKILLIIFFTIVSTLPNR